MYSHLILISFIVSTLSISIPSSYETEFQTTHYPSLQTYVSTLIVNEKNSSLHNFRSDITDMSLCASRHGIILHFNNKVCDVLIVDNGCSPYNMFYWLPISTHSNGCHRGTDNYFYMISDNFTVNYCFQDNTPVSIVINKPLETVVVRIQQWNIKTEPIIIPKVCNLFLTN